MGSARGRILVGGLQQSRQHDPEIREAVRKVIEHAHRSRLSGNDKG